MFEFTLAIMMLSRTELVTPALYAGAGFCIVAALVSSRGAPPPTCRSP
jgi:hypothetical protein